MYPMAPQYVMIIVAIMAFIGLGFMLKVSIAKHAQKQANKKVRPKFSKRKSTKKAS
jgi:uncharacterized membrane protein